VIIDEIGNLVLLDRSTDSSWGITPLLTSEMSFSPDGRKLVYPILAGKEVGLWILDVQTGEQTRLTDGTQ
jgi:Tol biopolymer transport system component